MASKYARRMVVPSDFAEVLKGFTREVLRNLPTDVAEEDADAWIYEFGASYFASRANSDPAPAFLQLDKLSSEQLEEKLVQLFMDADVDNSGSLDRKEFKSVRGVACRAHLAGCAARCGVLHRHTALPGVPAAAHACAHAPAVTPVAACAGVQAVC